MNRKDVILEQFLYSHNKNGWFVSFQSAVAGISEEDATWKYSEKDNSIMEIVNHLIFWNRRYLNRFKGVESPQMEGTNDSTFKNMNHLGWPDVVDHYDQLMEEWYDAVKACEEEKLDQQVSEEQPGSWLGTLTSITLHNAYHIGQIVSIRKIQGSWDPDQGVS
jgi:uncharacterized damage-inducible protein DinB